MVTPVGNCIWFVAMDTWEVQGAFDESLHTGGSAAIVRSYHILDERGNQIHLLPFLILRQRLQVA